MHLAIGTVDNDTVSIAVAPDAIPQNVADRLAANLGQYPEIILIVRNGEFCPVVTRTYLLDKHFEVLKW